MMDNKLKVFKREPLKGTIPILSGGIVRYEADPDWSHSYENEAHTQLTWNTQRGEWLADVSGTFLEGYERGQQLNFDYKDPTSTLNESACLMLLMAFNIDPNNVNLTEVPKMSPDRLEAIASQGVK
jgi:hypothetical protein